MEGYVQVYIGNGKGKTTAAIGLALRAAGAGLGVFIAQFAKQKECSEHKALERFSDLITVKRFGKGGFIKAKPTEKDIKAAHEGLRKAQSALVSGRYDVVILDEANVATHLGLFSGDELLRVIDLRPENVELVITGRHADDRIIDRADLVTEMVDVKHYHENGVAARKGIEY